MTDTELAERVRERYAAAARAVTSGSAGCCGSGATPDHGGATQDRGTAVDCCGDGWSGPGLYSGDERGELPEAAVLASLGCGNPTAVADLGEGETVLDLGSGGGIDVLLSARRVGPTGRAIGVDFTDEMLELARRNAAGAENVEFVKGSIEDLPLPDRSVDVVISNCVINLSVDKPAVFRELARVLRPGGRLGVSDVVAEDRLSPADRASRGDHAGCIAGALSVGEYREQLMEAGLADVEIILSHPVADGMHSAIIKAARPS